MFRYFDTVDVCKIRSATKEVRLNGFFPPHCLPGYITATYVTIEQTTEVDLTLYQSGIRLICHKDNTRLTVVVVKSCCDFLEMMC